MSKSEVTITELQSMVGNETGVSPWEAIPQERIDQFADVTGDHQFIHVDPERAKTETPFEGTIAHGFLTMSLVAKMSDALPAIANRRMGINYGFEKLRFLAPVPSGALRFDPTVTAPQTWGESRGRYSW